MSRVEISLLHKRSQTRKNKKERKIEIIQYNIVTKTCICITFILLVNKPCNQRPETTHIVPKVQESQGHSTLRPTARLQPKETFPENPRRRFRRQISLRNRRKRGQEELSFRQARNFAGRTVWKVRSGWFSFRYARYVTSRQEEREQRLRNNAVLKISRHQPKIVGILHDKEEGCQEGHREGCQRRSQVHAVLKISRHRPKSSASSTRQRRKAARDRKHHDDVDFRRKDVGTRFRLSKATLSLDRNLRAKALTSS